MEISLAAEKLFDLGPIEITNSLLTAIVLTILISGGLILISIRFRLEKPNKAQLFFEMIIKGFEDMSKEILDAKYSRRLFSFLFTFFIFIVISNWFGLLPIVGPIVVEKNEEELSEPKEVNLATKAQASEILDEHENADITFGKCIKDRDCILTTHGIKETEAIPLFRAPTSDVSATLAFALISVLTTNILGVASLKLSFFKKYINIKNPIDFFVGILETVSEFGKIISFTFRLFGNVFAGEVLLLVMTSLTLGIATLPFLFLEVFIGFIQAFVFFMLTMVFISLAITPHQH